MLRGLIIAAGAAIAIVGGMLLMLNMAAGIGPLICGLVLVIGTIFERVIYKPSASRAPGPDWVRTSERFVDPQTGKTVTVYTHPTTGERAYVNE